MPIKQKPFWTNQRLFAIHGWLGVNLGLMLFVICFSGSFAAIAHELDWLLNPALRTEAEAATTTIHWDDVSRRVKESYPDHRIQWISRPRGLINSYEAVVIAPGRHLERIYIHPQTGAVQATGSWLNTQRFFRDLHRILFTPTLGLYLVCFFSLVLLFSTITGLVFYKAWYRRLFTLRFRQGWRVLWSDLHRFVGVWSSVFSLIIAITGIWYLTEYSLGHSGFELAAKPPTISAKRLASFGPAVPEPLAAGELIARANAAFPELEPHAIYFPPNHSAPVRIVGQATALLVDDAANSVYLDPFSGEVLLVERGETIGLVSRWMRTVNPLHFGDWGGVASKLLWSIGGLSLSLLILSGGYLWILRSRQLAAGLSRRHSEQNAGDLDDRRRLQQAFRRRAIVGWLVTIALIALAAYSTPKSIQRYLARDPADFHFVGRATVGPWEIAALRIGAANQGSACCIDFLGTGDRANFKQAEVWLGNEKPTGKTARAGGNRNRLQATLPATAANQPTPALWIAITDWGGVRHAAKVCDDYRVDKAPSAADASLLPPANVAPVAPGVLAFVWSFAFIQVAIIIGWFWWIWLARPFC